MSQSAQAMVDLYIKAEQDVLEGKTTTVNGRIMAMEDLPAIRDGRKEWERRLLQESAASSGKPRKCHGLASFD